MRKDRNDEWRTKTMRGNWPSEHSVECQSLISQQNSVLHRDQWLHRAIPMSIVQPETFAPLKGIRLVRSTRNNEVLFTSELNPRIFDSITSCNRFHFDRLTWLIIPIGLNEILFSSVRVQSLNFTNRSWWEQVLHVNVLSTKSKRIRWTNRCENNVFYPSLWRNERLDKANFEKQLNWNSSSDFVERSINRDNPERDEERHVGGHCISFDYILQEIEKDH